MVVLLRGLAERTVDLAGDNRDCFREMGGIVRTRYPSTIDSLIVPPFFLSCSASSGAAFSARTRACDHLEGEADVRAHFIERRHMRRDVLDLSDQVAGSRPVSQALRVRRGAFLESKNSSANLRPPERKSVPTWAPEIVPYWSASSRESSFVPS